MSILWSLRKLVDSIQHRQEEAARRRDRSRSPRPLAGAGSDQVEPMAESVEPLRRCRVCGLHARERYCPACLADTMELIPDPEK